MQTKSFLQHSLQVCAFLGFSVRDERAKTPLRSLLIQLLPQLDHLLRILQQEINRGAQTYRRRVAAGANVRDRMILDILYRKPVRVHGT